MKRLLLLAAVAALPLSACADAGRSPAAPESPRFATGDRWSIFTTETPEEFLTTPDSAWEVATRFRSSKPGCIVGMKFYRATGESGTNTLKLWSNSGTLLRSKNVTATGSGTKIVMLKLQNLFDDSYCIQANTDYRVSVNTNVKQAKTYAYFTNYGSITKGPLTADYSYYGQPAGSFPTTGSGSIYFVDVIFEES